MFITRSNQPATPPTRNLPTAPAAAPAPQPPADEPKDYVFLGFSHDQVRTMGIGAAEGTALTLLSKGAEAVGLGFPVMLGVSAYGAYRGVLENRDAKNPSNPVVAGFLGVGKMQFMTGALGWDVASSLAIGSIAGAYYAHTEGPVSGKYFQKPAV